MSRNRTGAVYSQSNLRDLTTEYVDRIYRSGVDPAQLAETAFQSEHLAVAYRDRFLPRPVFLEPGESARLGEDMVLMHRLLSALPDRLFGGDRQAFCRALGMLAAPISVVTRTPSGPLPVLARSDLYRASSGFKLLELNITSALGGFENALLNRAMLEHPMLAEFVRDRELVFCDTFHAIAMSMLRELGDRVTGREAVVALADWPESFKTYEPRLHVMAALMREMNIEAIPCHVGQISERDGRLEVQGRVVDVVFRFFLLEELVSPSDLALVEPILSAAERGDVLLFSRMDAEAYGNKGALAMISDERHADCFSEPERDMIRRFLPWTRYIRPQVTDPGGDLIPLARYARANQQELILKPIMLHGGSGVVAGWRVGADEWMARCDEAMGGPWVLQQRVHPEPEAFPEEGSQGSYDVYFNWGAFVAEPEVVGGSGYAGCLARGSVERDVGVVSMGSGAVVACCFHPEERQQ